MTDHLPNFVIIKKVNLKKSNLKLYRRDYSKLNERQVINEIDQINWEHRLSNSSDINEIFNVFHSNFEVIINKYAPLKPLSKKDARRKEKMLD